MYILKRLLSILLFVCACTTSNGQQGNIVTFGLKGGLNFNSQPPSVFTSNISGADLLVARFSFTISDCEGNLLFYAMGDSVWNKNHQLMDNGAITAGNNGWDLDVKIVPIPDSAGYYYIFYNSFLPDNKLCFAVVDMNLNGGLGKVILKDQVLDDIANWRELGLTKHANGKDYWLLHKHSDDTLFSYQISKTGIGSPVVNIVKGVQRYTSLKFNNAGTKISVSCGHHRDVNPTYYTNFAAYVYDFNNATGILSNPKPTLQWHQLPVRHEISSMVFSPNDSILYLSNWAPMVGGPVQNRRLLFQVLLYSLNPLFYQNKLIDQPIGFEANVYGMLLGPDNKIYMTEGIDTNKISIMHKPDVFGTGCQLQRGALDISPAKTGYTMGSVYQSVYDVRFKTNANDSSCTDTAFFIITGDTSRFKQYIIFYGDGDSSILSNSSHIVSHKYPNEGKYNVKLKSFTKECNFPIWRTDSVTIRFKPKAFFVTDSINISCGNRVIYLRDSSQHTDSFLFTWHPNKTQYSNKKNTSFSLSIDSSASYSLTHIVKNDWGCTDTFRQSIPVSIPDFPKKGFSIAGTDTSGCVPHQITVHDSGKYSTITIFHWGDGDSLITSSPGNVVAQYQRTYTLSGTFRPYQIVRNADGCKDTFFYPATITVLNRPKAGFDVAVDSTCSNFTLTLTDTSFFADSTTYTSPFYFLGKSGSIATQTFTVNNSYTLFQKVWNRYCADSISLSIPLFKKHLPDVGISIDKLSGCAPFTVFFSDDSTAVAINKTRLDYGNGDADIDNSPWKNHTYTYTTVGTYKAVLSDTSLNGCYASDSAEITVYGTPIAKFTHIDSNRCGKLTTIITDNSLFADSVEIRWGMQTDTIVQGTTISYTYPFASNNTLRTIYLIAKTSNGCVDIDSASVTQTSHIAPAEPNMLGVSVTDKHTVVLEWNSVPSAESYHIEHSKTGSAYALLTTVVPNPSITQTFVQSNQPTDDINLFYKVVAVDSCKVTSYESRIAKTILLKAQLDDSEIAILEWTPYEEWQKGVLEYRVEYRDKTTSNSNPMYFPLTATSPLNTQDSDPSFSESDGDERCYRITATENGGNNYSSFSNEVCLPQKPVLIIPNAFTPNGDGKNDVFTVTASSIAVIKMDIYNRYGQLIYSETSQQPSWDGTFQNDTVQFGSYMVMISAKAKNNKKINYSGIINVLR